MPSHAAKRLDRVAIALIDYAVMAAWAGLLVAMVFIALVALVALGLYVVAYV